MDDGLEIEVLEQLSKSLVAKKDEIVRFLQERVANPSSAAESVTKSLYSKGLITYVTPIGQTCYAITQKGMRALRDRTVR